MNNQSPQQQIPQQQPQNEPTKKLGAGHAGATFRAGLKELGQIVSAFPDGVQPVEEYGLYGTALPQEVYSERNPDQQMDVNQNIGLSK